MLEFHEITIDHVKEITLWRYTGYMKDIYMKPYFDNYRNQSYPLRGPDDCHGYAVYSGTVLYGIFEYYFRDGIMEIGLALNPDFVGKGNSKQFILRGIDFAIQTYHYRQPYIMLTVEIKNEPAYYAYLKAGFTEITRNEEDIVMHYYIQNTKV